MIISPKGLLDIVSAPVRSTTSLAATDRYYFRLSRYWCIRLKSCFLVIPLQLLWSCSAAVARHFPPLPKVRRASVIFGGVLPYCNLLLPSSYPIELGKYTTSSTLPTRLRTAPSTCNSLKTCCQCGINDCGLDKAEKSQRIATVNVLDTVAEFVRQLVEEPTRSIVSTSEYSKYPRRRREEVEVIGGRPRYPLQFLKFCVRDFVKRNYGCVQNILVILRWGSVPLYMCTCMKTPCSA